MRVSQFFVLLLLNLYFLSVSSAREVVYPNVDGIGKESIGFSVLKLALKKSQPDLEVKLHDIEVNQERALKMVLKNTLDVFDAGFHADYEKLFDPIYLPIDRGILGWRLFIIHRENQAKFASVQGIDDLKGFLAGQGSGWGDIKILKHAGIKVVTSSRISNLVKMVGSKRFDMFPLGANEIYRFVNKYGENNEDIIVEENLTLVYPFGRFFYVKKGNSALAHAIDTGMEMALEDGSLQSLLENHAFYKDAFSKARLNDRLRIDVDTPGLTTGFKSIHPKWWFLP